MCVQCYDKNNINSLTLYDEHTQQRLVLAPLYIGKRKITGRIHFLTNFSSFTNSNNWIYIEMRGGLFIDFKLLHISSE